MTDDQREEHELLWRSPAPGWPLDANQAANNRDALVRNSQSRHAGPYCGGCAQPLTCGWLKHCARTGSRQARSIEDRLDPTPRGRA